MFYNKLKVKHKLVYSNSHIIILRNCSYKIKQKILTIIVTKIQ